MDEDEVENVLRRDLEFSKSLAQDRCVEISNLKNALEFYKHFSQGSSGVVFNLRNENRKLQKMLGKRNKEIKRLRQTVSGLLWPNTASNLEGE